MQYIECVLCEKFVRAIDQRPIIVGVFPPEINVNAVNIDNENNFIDFPIDCWLRVRDPSIKKGSCTIRATLNDNIIFSYTLAYDVSLALSEINTFFDFSFPLRLSLEMKKKSKFCIEVSFSNLNKWILINSTNFTVIKSEPNIVKN